MTAKQPISVMDWLKLIGVLLGFTFGYATLQSQVSMNTGDISENKATLDKKVGAEYKAITDLLHKIDKKASNIETQIEIYHGK
jgi:hypothetical protein